PERAAICGTCGGAALLPARADRRQELLGPPEPPLATELGEYLETEEAKTPVEAPPDGSAQPAPAYSGVLLLGEPEPLPGEPAGPRREPILKDLPRVELATRRLRQVCKTLARDRQPYCPVNGVVSLVPLAATASPGDP